MDTLSFLIDKVLEKYGPLTTDSVVFFCLVESEECHSLVMHRSSVNYFLCPAIIERLNNKGDECKIYAPIGRFWTDGRNYSEEELRVADEFNKLVKETIFYSFKMKQYEIGDMVALSKAQVNKAELSLRLKALT